MLRKTEAAEGVQKVAGNVINSMGEMFSFGKVYNK